MKKVRKIDIHSHVIVHHEYEYPEKLTSNLKNQLEVWDSLDIEKGILLPIVSPEAQPVVMPNGDACYLAKQHPERFYWFCNVDPRAMWNSPNTNLGKMLEFFKNEGAKGLGELTANLYADDPMVDNLFSYCEELDMPVTIHIGPTKGGCYGLVDELGLPRLDKMMTKHPKLKILGHSQPFWAEISADVTQESRGDYPAGKVTEGALAMLLRKHENLYCDMSAGSGTNAMLRDEDNAYRFIEEFADRMMYAIDFCGPDEFDVSCLSKWLDKSVENGSISEKNYYNICRGNAKRIIKLDDLED